MAALFLICAIAYFPYLLSPMIGGFDSYHYLSALNIPQSSFLLVKVATFLCLFASAVFIGLLGEVFDQKNGWAAGYFAFGSLVFLSEFWKLETEQFAYPILFLSVFLFFKGRKALACLLLIPATLIWNGSILYLFAFTLHWIWLTPFAFTALAFLYNRVGMILPNQAVQENTPIFGVFYQAFLLFGARYVPKKLLWATGFFLIVAFLNAKYAIHLVPFLSVGVVFLFNEKNISFKALAIAGPAIVILFLALFVPTYPPTVEQASAVKLAIQEVKGEVVYNDWAWGHVIEYYGGRPLAKGGGEQPDLNCSGCVVLTRKEIDCRCLNCPSFLAVYRC